MTGRFHRTSADMARVRDAQPLPAAMVAAFTAEQLRTILATYAAKRALCVSRGLDTANLDRASAQVAARLAEVA